MISRCEVVLLCEDVAQSCLVLGFLKRAGFRSVRSLITGEGAGEQWVRIQYPIQVNSYRLAKGRKDTRLIVVIDADKGTVGRRIQQLDQALKDFEENRLRNLDATREKIARLVPRRNVETWILALNDNSVNEEEDYKQARSREEWPRWIRRASSVLYDWTRPNAPMPEDTIPSLSLGMQERIRVFPKSR